MNTFMAAAPMVSSYSQLYDAPGHLDSHSGVSTRHATVKIPSVVTPRPTPKEVRLPVVDPRLYMHRRESTREALGAFRLTYFFCFRLYFSSDVLTGTIPMGITVVLIVANMSLVWHQVGWGEYICALLMLATTFTSYFLTISSDPGIYPRLRSGERDPLEGNTLLVFCKECLLRRPPRCAHCYHCRVCVLEHDHHCSVLGCCVGVRNLRWFTLYLLSCCCSTMIGVVWLTRYLFYDLFVADDAGERDNDLKTVLTPYPTVHSGRPSFSPDSDTASHLGAIFVLLLDGVVVMLVGSMLCLYTYLTLTSTTRRESIRRQNSLKTLLQPLAVWRNFRKLLSPPPSLLSSDGGTDEQTTNLI